MGRFENSIVTLSGVDMLNEQLIGRKMTVTSVCTGSGMTDVSELEKITELQDQKQKGRLVSLEDADTYKRIRIQLSNSGLGESYQLHQVLVMAALDELAVPGGYQEQSFVVMQDDVGINVPSEEDAPGWELEMYCVIALDNKLHIDIVVDPAGTAKLKDLERAMARHNADTEAHPELLKGITPESIGTYTKEEIDKRSGVTSVNGKTGAVQITPEAIGALPLTGGVLSNFLNVGRGISLFTNNEGGNFDIFPPEVLPNFWEFDAFDGNLRIMSVIPDGYQVEGVPLVLNRDAAKSQFSGNAATATQANHALTADTATKITVEQSSAYNDLHSGLFFVPYTADLPDGKPFHSFQLLNVDAGGGYGFQMAFGNDTATPQCKVRSKTAGSWSAWKTLPILTSSPFYRTVTLTVEGWIGKTQTVTVTGVSATETDQLIIPTPALASRAAYQAAGIQATAQGDNSLTFTAETVPTAALTVYVAVLPF